MGRIKTALVKRLTKELVREHRDKLATNFEDNKNLFKVVANMPSKKIRNIVAGYATRLKKVERAD